METSYTKKKLKNTVKVEGLAAAKKILKVAGDPGDSRITSKLVPECRVHSVPFTIFFIDRDPEKEKCRPADKHFHEKLLFQSQGILDFVISGCLQWQETGLATRPIIIDVTKNYWCDINLIGRFINECCYEDPDAETTAKDLFNSFKHWWKFNTTREVLSQKKFGSIMGLKYSRRKEGIFIYSGIGINNDFYRLDD